MERKLGKAGKVIRSPCRCPVEEGERRNEGWVAKVLDNGAVLRKFQQSQWGIFEPIVIHQRNPTSPRNWLSYCPSVFSCCLGTGLGSVDSLVKSKDGF